MHVLVEDVDSGPWRRAGWFAVVYVCQTNRKKSKKTYKDNIVPRVSTIYNTQIGLIIRHVIMYVSMPSAPLTLCGAKQGES